MTAMRIGIIYCATTPSGKRYVGQTIETLARRISRHKSSAQCPAIHAAVKKYGDAMEWRILAMVGEPFLDDTERMYIGLLSPELNLTAGGEGGKPTAKSRAKTSATLKGKPKPPRTAEHRANHSASLRGKKRAPRSPEWCAKLSQAKREWWAQKRAAV